MELPALSDLFFCGTGSGDSGRKLDVWQELAAIFTRRAKQQDDRLGRRMDQLGSRAECVETDAGKRRKVFLSSAAQAGGRDAGLDTGTHSLCCSGFCVLALYGGFSMGWVITMCTLENGMFGLPVFLLSCFPQFLFYIPVWSLLAWWGLSGNRRLRVLPTFLAAGFLGLGAAAEAFWNPFFLKIL